MSPFQKRMVAPLVVACGFFISSCQTVDIYEKNVAVPNHEWNSAFKPTFNFTIKDTTTSYQLYVVLRHNEKYHWSNIWINLQAQMPGATPQSFKIEIPLANNEKGWLGSAMDDIYEHRIPITIDPEKFNFTNAGEYNFAVAHIMREDPLQNVMNVGLRVEKKPQ
jgi:gliding motility-associated lipoprotein GldH